MDFSSDKFHNKTRIRGAVCDLTRDYIRLHVHMEFSSACDSIEDYCLMLYVCTNDNYVWGKGCLRANWVYRIHTE